MRISKKGLCALEAAIVLAKRHSERATTRIHGMAVSEGIPEMFLEPILLGSKQCLAGGESEGRQRRVSAEAPAFQDFPG